MTRMVIGVSSDVGWRLLSAMMEDEPTLPNKSETEKRLERLEAEVARLADTAHRCCEIYLAESPEPDGVEPPA